MALQPFTWGMGGQQITSPEQAERQRAIAEALIGQSATPASNWAEGLGDVAAALSGTVLNNRVAEAEAAGRERAGGLFADLAVNSDPNSIIAALTSPDSAWASPAQTSIASALLKSGLERQDPMYQLQLQQAQADLANTLAGGGGDETFFGNIVPMQDANGNIVLGQASNRARWQPLQGADGYSPAPTTKQLDTGTEIITTDIYGNELYRTPKQNYDAAYQSAGGTAAGKIDVENKTNLGNALATAERSIANIEALEADPNLWTAVGMLGPLPAIPGTSQAGVVSRIEQLQGGTFLEAYNTLKGGGQITEVEGRKAEQAIARLNRAQNEADFRQALQELKEVIRAGAVRAREKAGQPAQATPSSSPTSASPQITIRKISD